MTETNQILVVTTNDLPGYEILEVYGEVLGLVVRSRNIFSSVGSSLLIFSAVNHPDIK